MSVVHEQLKASIEAHDRAMYLGSSEIASVLGMSPWRTAYDVWESKQPGYVDYSYDEAREKRLSRGKRFEPVILDQYQEEYGAWITGRNLRYIDADYPFMTSEVDAEQTEESTGEVSNVEIKSVSHFAAGDWGSSGTDEIPAYYAAQVMFSLMVSGRDRSTVVALIGSDDLRVYPISRDEELIRAIRQRAIDFWNNHVVSGIPPAIQNSVDAEKMVARFSGVTVEATEEVRAALLRLADVKREIVNLEIDRDAQELFVKKAMAQASGGEPGKFQLVDCSGLPLATWNLINRKAYTTSVPESSYRVLRIEKGIK
jgi:putative phage-type endonuclease